MHIHFRANMDFWDPLLVKSLAKRRTVILFDQPGTGRSEGEAAQTFRGWAENVIALCDALKLPHIDLLGFSMGGCAVQMVALLRPDLVRRLILAGTTPSAPDGSRMRNDGRHTDQERAILWPREEPPGEPIRLLATAKSQEEIQEALFRSFFPHTATGRQAFQDYWMRIGEQLKTKPDDDSLSNARFPVFVGPKGSRNQRLAFREFSIHNPSNSFDRLSELKMPVLVLNGEDDLLIPTSRSWELARRIEGAKLIIYPRSGHGFIWQHAETVARDVNEFLDQEDVKVAELARL